MNIDDEKVKWTCSKFKYREDRVALFGDFKSEIALLTLKGRLRQSCDLMGFATINFLYSFIVLPVKFKL